MKIFKLSSQTTGSQFRWFVWATSMGAFVFYSLIIQIQLFVFVLALICSLIVRLFFKYNFYAVAVDCCWPKTPFCALKKSKPFKYGVCLAFGQKLISFFKCCKWLLHISVCTTFCWKIKTEGICFARCSLRNVSSN